MTAARPLPVPETILVETLRFGTLMVPAEAAVHFPEGLPGFDGLRHFVVIDVRPDVAWLQSSEHPALAFLLVRPWRVVAGAWGDDDSAWAIVTPGKAPNEATANLMAPVRIDPVTHTGRQHIHPDSPWSSAERFDLAAT